MAISLFGYVLQLIYVDKKGVVGTLLTQRRGSSVVEHVPEEHSVDGSIPSPGTSLRSLELRLASQFFKCFTVNFYSSMRRLPGEAESEEGL